MASCAGLSLNGLVGILPVRNHQRDAPGRRGRTGKLSHPTMADRAYGCVSVREVFGRIIEAGFPRRG